MFKNIYKTFMKELSIKLSPHDYWCDGDKQDCSNCGNSRYSWRYRLWRKYN